MGTFQSGWLWEEGPTELATAVSEQFLLEAGKNDINQLAFNTTVPAFFDSPREWGPASGRKESRSYLGRAGELPAE
jgi:hypothetical protein